VATLHLVTWLRRPPAPGSAEAEAVALAVLADQHRRHQHRRHLATMTDEERSTRELIQHGTAGAASWERRAAWQQLLDEARGNLPTTTTTTPVPAPAP